MGTSSCLVLATVLHVVPHSLFVLLAMAFAARSVSTFAPLAAAKSFTGRKVCTSVRPAAARRTALTTVCEGPMDKVMQVLEGEVSVDSIKSSELYTKYVEPVVSNDLFKSNTGFTAGAEIINCRAAMVGALAALGAEIFGKGPFLEQLSEVSPAALSIMALITGASIYATYKGADGEQAVKDLDVGLEDSFTPSVERTNGRLAMAALAILIVVESVKGSALL